MEAEALKAFAREGSILSTSSGRLHVAAGPRKWMSSPSSFAWYFPDFFLTNPTPYSCQKPIDLPEIEFPATQEKLPWSSGDFAPFAESWTALNHLDKIVPYAAIHARGVINPLSVLHNAMAYHRKTPGTTLYGFWGPEGGMIGVTPELLCSVKENCLKTMACAGTGKKGENLLADPKLIAEHGWVIEGISQSLASLGRVSLGKTGVKDFGRLSHLITEMTCMIEEGVSFDEAISKLHPTPALGAFPKIQGQAWLQSYQKKIPRNRFGAPLGYIDANTGEGECYVAIRNVQWEGNHASILCGAGITQESVLEAEKEEVCLKWQAVKEILGL
jgi:isochorismate synthase EntC